MIRYALVRVLMSCGSGALVFLAVSQLATRLPVDVPTSGSEITPTDTRAASGTARVATLLARHGCWSGAAPKDAPIPGHAVVTPPGGTPRLVDGDVGFAIWLDGEPGVLHGFCP